MQLYSFWLWFLYVGLKNLLRLFPPFPLRCWRSATPCRTHANPPSCWRSLLTSLPRTSKTLLTWWRRCGSTSVCLSFDWAQSTISSIVWLHTICFLCRFNLSFKRSIVPKIDISISDCLVVVAVMQKYFSYEYWVMMAEGFLSDRCAAGQWSFLSDCYLQSLRKSREGKYSDLIKQILASTWLTSGKRKVQTQSGESALMLPCYCR